MQIPFVDLSAQYRQIKVEIDAAIKSVIDETAFIGGHRVGEFEKAFAKAQGAEHCVAVANGTDAIYIALRMLGIGAGDEVITVANSWISTSETVSQTGAKPIFVDINQYSNIDVDKISDKLTDKTKAIIPVHLYGQPADVDQIKKVCDSRGIYLLEDCAQSHLAEIGGVKVGNIGDVGTFSFYPGKNLGAYGDAGAIVTNSSELAEKCRMYAHHGALKKHEHRIEGINSRMDGIQAAVLNVKLPHLKEWTTNRQRIANRYIKRLQGVDQLVLPTTAPNRNHVFHLFVVRTIERDLLRQHLEKLGIQTGVHYPTALPMLRAYDHLGYNAADFPRAVEFQNQILSLPIFPEMSNDQVDYVSNSIHSFF